MLSLAKNPQRWRNEEPGHPLAGRSRSKDEGNFTLIRKDKELVSMISVRGKKTLGEQFLQYLIAYGESINA
jgi:hypothetical protein